MNKRIWELDALRGLCVLGMVIVHFIFDLTELYGIVRWQTPEWFAFLQSWGGVLFLLISGTCATFGSRSVRRGVMVLGFGLVISAATWVMFRFMGFHRAILIYFGVLHCLGVCMILWPLFKKAPVWLLLLLAAAMVGLGLWFDGLTVAPKWLIPLGLTPRGFASSDYFPLLPHLGFFLMGAAFGKTFYRQKQSLFPNINENAPILRFLQWCGRSSLWIYLLHQPILSGICMLLMK